MRKRGKTLGKAIPQGHKWACLKHRDRKASCKAIRKLLFWFFYRSCPTPVSLIECTVFWILLSPEKFCRERRSKWFVSFAEQYLLFRGPCGSLWQELSDLTEEEWKMNSGPVTKGSFVKNWKLSLFSTYSAPKLGKKKYGSKLQAASVIYSLL